MTLPHQQNWIGKPVRRLEDARLLTGQGRFTDDIEVKHQAHAAFVRSPHAHARVVAVDAAAAREAPGVIAVLTGADAVADGLGSLPFFPLHKRPDGSPITAAPRLPLTADVARFVGDAVALVVAETSLAARDAAELVAVEWEPLPAVVDTDAAEAPGAPLVWPPAGSNLAAMYEFGDDSAVEKALAAARHRVKVRIVNNRVVSNPIEPRAAIGEYDAASGRYTLQCCSQGTHLVRKCLAEDVFKIPLDKLRVITPDVGGGFGTKVFPYPEYAAVLWAARRTGRPVKWLSDRSEAFLSDAQGRDNVSEAELGLDAEGRFTALRIRSSANIGAYISHYGSAVPAMAGARTPTGAYRIPLLRHEVRMLFTNTVSVDAYRGAGRPEMAYLIERVVDRAAMACGFDPVDLRRRNLIRRADMPFTNPVGTVYEPADFIKVLDEAAAAADWEGYPARKRAAEARGLLAGRGIAFYIEPTGSGNLTEAVNVSVGGDGVVRLQSGTQAMGQGLWTSYAQIVAERLGVSPESITLVQGDTGSIASGGGSGGSRSLQVGGGAVRAGADAWIEVARPLAAEALEAAAPDIEFGAGQFRIAGTDRSIGPFELAARQPDRRIGADGTYTADAQTYPNGCQVCEVEIDPDTGVVRLVRMVAVDDIGTVVNPLIVEGQLHGGVAQGVGQALLEECVYDRESGQLVTGSFQDYAMPRADDLPAFLSVFDQSSPSQSNALGAKGVGEAGPCGAAPAVVHAVIDALRSFGVDHVDMPVTREKVWRLLRRKPA
ncbi:MAG: xanthine dehydrogenase family protein molybdopterin-binding subunit [Betaproteobacteria bacterium]|nr:xanthine dehydrogenase family protein molybdopterin-binding subunit [Betaproteobacteria bacterium]